VLLQRDREVSQLYRADTTPSAVVVKHHVIDSPLAVGMDAIRALVRDETVPPPLRRGDRVPSLRLRDLAGGAMDLATLRDRRTLLLFWNPSCGFCQEMLESVKVWERNRPSDAPELLVVSAGSPAANRAQGFRSRVLLDPTFSAGQMLGANGTPSALIVDEEGRVASELRSGASAVFALAGAVPVGASGRVR
jgi:thiol-disulfide isomerase/thioredoxin